MKDLFTGSSTIKNDGTTKAIAGDLRNKISISHAIYLEMTEVLSGDEVLSLPTKPDFQLDSGHFTEWNNENMDPMFLKSNVFHTIDSIKHLEIINSCNIL